MADFRSSALAISCLAALVAQVRPKWAGLRPPTAAAADRPADRPLPQKSTFGEVYAFFGLLRFLCKGIKTDLLEMKRDEKLEYQKS